jgi:carboxymethylenebutenolidase
MIEKQIDIPTTDGATTTFVCHPERGGPHPAIVFFMDAPAIREELRDMVRRLASVGYYVVLPISTTGRASWNSIKAREGG